MENKKLRKSLLLLLTILLLGSVIYALSVKRDIPNTEDGNNSQNTQIEDQENGTLTPEEVIKQLEGDSTLEGDIVMSIISPEEKTFEPQQARLWKAKLDNVENDSSFSVNCHWKFYMNEKDEEVLYKEMENRSGLSKENTEICGFTSTFIDRVGKLRVVLEAEVVKSSSEILKTFTAERKYTVL